MTPTSAHRHGTILIIVAGISALLASMSLVFLARMRSDVDETWQFIQEAQARLMLSAACCYLQEASRLGYDFSATQGTNFHPEGYGWIDVRDGAVGPKAAAIPATDDVRTFFHTVASPTAIVPSRATTTYTYQKNEDGFFPIGASRRFDMFMKTIPPFAIRLDAAPNPIDPTNGIPYLSRPDPLPVVPESWNWSNPTAADFAEFERGDPRPIQHSTGRAWFRLHRCGPGHPRSDYAAYNAATFIVTVGAGGTGGFRFYGTPPSGYPREMSAADEQQFASAADFAALQAAELRQWYLVEWSPAVSSQYMFNVIHHRGPKLDANGENFAITQYAQFTQNYQRYSHSQAKQKNFGGTIRLVQRLLKEPPEW